MGANNSASRQRSPGSRNEGGRIQSELLVPEKRLYKPSFLESRTRHPNLPEWSHGHNDTCNDDKADSVQYTYTLILQAYQFQQQIEVRVQQLKRYEQGALLPWPEDMRYDLDLPPPYQLIPETPADILTSRNNNMMDKSRRTWWRGNADHNECVKNHTDHLQHSINCLKEHWTEHFIKDTPIL